jgi:tetratricopeptide (TPR) repeat protein
MHDLAYAHYGQRKYDIAETLFEKALRGSEAVLTKSHPMTHMAAQNLALVYDLNGKQDAAEEQCVRAIAGLERTLRPNHSDTLRAIQILAQIRAHQGRSTEAVQLLQRVLDGRKETLGLDAEYTVWTREKLEYLKQTGTLDVRRDT